MFRSIHPLIKSLFLFFGIALSFYLLMAAFAWFFRPALEKESASVALERDEVLPDLRAMDFNPDLLPVIYREVDYAEGVAGDWYPKGESPILAELVAAGKLPPVAERVGEEPLVLQGVDGIGNYGGTWMRIAPNDGDAGIITNRLSASTLVRWSPGGYPIVPHMAKSWERNEDGSEWTFHLRRGIRWSDGHPFTADDVLYWWEWDQMYFGVHLPIAYVVGGEPMEVEKVDDYTVVFRFAAPYGSFLEFLANPSRQVYAPKHYLGRYHPEIGDPELIAEGMEHRGISSPVAFYNSLKNWRNPEHPRMWPWVYRTHRSQPPETFVRNPYYWVVDEQGQQLPYLDRVMFEVRAELLLPISVAGGGVSMQHRGLRFSDYTLLMENRSRNEYEVYHWYPATRSEWMMAPNLNRRVEPGDSVSGQKAALLRERDFRIALSLAIDRQRIIDSLYSGVGEPAQIDPGPGSPYENENLRYAYVEFDPERANKMLDALGLTQRDSQGMRTFPNGERMSWFIDFTVFTGEGPAQFIVDDWARVGIRAVMRERNRALFIAQKSSLVNDFTVWSSESDFYPMTEARSFLPFSLEANYAISYANWFANSGLYGSERVPPGAQEPEIGSPIRRNMELYEKARQSATLDEQVELFRQITDTAANEMWTISIATAPPALAVVKNGFRNVPRQALVGYTFGTPGNTGIETYFWDEPWDSAGAIAQIKREMTTIDPGRFGVRAVESEGASWGATLRWLLIVSLVLVVILLAVRHPFIGRRLLIMMPTLLIISIVCFVIIDLPPGDFVETRMQQLEATGDYAAMEEISRLRELFHLDEALWQRYLRWMGVVWFFTFDSSDQGLLQGNMGRSMETLDSVNAMVGDRIALTFWVSLGTVIFTWMIALPIGIYSAVRQYSISDYTLSFIGFLGMCIPNFLLAILLMYVSDRYFGVNVSGLFSEEYAAQPEWSWGKVVDLLKHVWIPIVVIATAGTASMIRIMRGNLLDELGKPYVTTARAKGVRPLKLLLKYPVRLALNPFISGIGSIFPQLVSGGAIVAIVLSLPMIGPLLLSSLMSEDIYMAASMLMILSLLGVVGTLISDLMLMWVDPRIRMGGGTR
jgi:ABC-type dipeptide/oligopeptide/nickel transport system permease component/ABC-type transport system substrate-binding protein